jgi:hypothetical protein
MTDWYGERHVRDLKAMGMNTIRFMMNYRIFEDNARPGVFKPEGWAFIDRYIEWARKHDLYIILDMHSPQGGFQSWGGGGALWSDRSNQQRLIRLWRAIADRYRNEPRIAAYDLLNEPLPPTPADWQRLAQQIVDAIRSVDVNHLIIVEHVLWVTRGASDWSLPLLKSFQITVNDPAGGENLMYDTHFYEPKAFALQLTPATNNRDGGRYPDPQRQDRMFDGRRLPRNRAQLEHQLKLAALDFMDKHNVSMNIGEWAPGDVTLGDKGGLEYIRDLLELFDRHGLSWQFYSFNEFHTDGSLQRLKSEPANTFRTHFSGKKGGSRETRSRNHSSLRNMSARFLWVLPLAPL